MAHILAQILRRVIKHRRRRPEAAAQIPAAETVERHHLKMAAQRVGGEFGGENPVVKFGEEHLIAHRRELAVEFPAFELAARHQTLPRRKPGEFALRRRAVGEFGHLEFPGADVKRRQRIVALAEIERHQKIADRRIEHARIDDRARSDDPGDRAFDDALGQLRILELLRDGDLDPGIEQARQLRVKRVIGKSAHGIALPLGQRQLHQRAAPHRVVEEHFVEVPEPEEQNRILGDIGLGRAVLLHHRGESGVIHRFGCFPPGAHENHIGCIIMNLL
ncbi:hypothetical protein SDC9_81938 [bioreactor metagenome]|uniref:Uncharacterized protein n=1 Tax=bioreactor metagenome TaxID=1076179 RepID=A0A644Z411_9ZZZZ